MKKSVGASILGLENKIEVVNNVVAKNIPWIHYDVMDGTMVPRETLPEKEIDLIVKNAEKHIIDIHLMVSDPIKYIQKYKEFADYITFHYEMESIDKIRKIIRKFGDDVKIGIAINPSTNIEQIFEFIPSASHILVMSVVPGKGGQKFIPESLDKIKRLREYIDKLKAKTFIQVDGGINGETGPEAIKAGADALVSGSYLVNNLEVEGIENIILKGHK